MAIILYARKSVERENSISCETQLEYCKSVIRPDERDEEIITFVDNGFSGGNINRDGFQEMMKMVRQNKVSKVIVYRLDRISRSLSDFVTILQEFKAHHVEFVSSQESFDTSSPYGELIVKILMVFAEFERTSAINRVTQAYAHRSDMGFYMGGRKPYGFELIPAVIHNVKTKKLNPIPSETEQVKYIFAAYSQENISLRGLLTLLVEENRKPSDESTWSTSKLSTLLKNPIYVKANSDVYDYYEQHGVRIITDVSLFTGEYGAQLYGHTKHNQDAPDWSDMKLVLLTHSGIIDPDIWLKCQKKLEKNKRTGKTISNHTSWLSGMVICEKCGHTMTTIKGKANKEGKMRRYFNCTGRSHEKICTGKSVTIYANDLEKLVYDCIFQKLSGLKETGHTTTNSSTAEMNELKLKLKMIEQAEKQLLDTIFAGGLHEDLLAIANQKATQLKKDKLTLCEQIEDLRSRSGETYSGVDLAQFWKTADYNRKKATAMLMIHKIIISEDGNTKILWNI